MIIHPSVRKVKALRETFRTRRDMKYAYLTKLPCRAILMKKAFGKTIMLKDLGVKPYAFPMPVLLIATYGEDGKVDVMNMAWGGICAENMIALNIDEEHKTSANIKARGAFTVSVADVPHIEAADFFGIASGNKMPDKFERSGLHAVKSTRVDAPVVEEFPLTLECKVVECQLRVPRSRRDRQRACRRKGTR